MALLVILCPPTPGENCQPPTGEAWRGRLYATSNFLSGLDLQKPAGERAKLRDDLGKQLVLGTGELVGAHSSVPRLGPQDDLR